MLGVGQQPRRSPATSGSDSYRGGTMSRQDEHPYQQHSPIPEEPEREDNEYETTLDDIDEQPRNIPAPPREDQYLAALRHRFPNRPKTDYAYSKPLIHTLTSGASASESLIPTGATTTQIKPTTASTATNTTASKNGAYQSSVRPTNTGTITTTVADDKPFLISNLRRVNPDQKNTYAQRLNNQTTSSTSAQTQPIGSNGAKVRINDQNIGINRSNNSTFLNQSELPKTQESIFEKVHSQGGSVSYLGTGTFSQFEHCLRECLERERRQLGITSHITRHDIPTNRSVHDFTCDSNLISSHQAFYPSHNHHFIDYPSRANAEFSLDDIRYINVALSRHGIPLLPYPRSYHESYPSSVPMSSTSMTMHSTYPTERHVTGEIVSACRLVDDDPAIIRSRNPI